MCLIISKPSNITISEELLTKAQANNKDGWGIMWAQNNRVQTIKGFGLDKLKDAVNDPDFAASQGFVHLRWSTSGKVNDENCHPFKVTNNIFMMHNGVFNINTPDNNMSDTWHFTKFYLRPMLVAYPTAFLDPDWVEDMEYFVGSNKMVILNSQGDFNIVNKKMWYERDGLLLSNLNSCSYTNRVVSGKGFITYYPNKYVIPSQTVSTPVKEVVPETKLTEVVTLTAMSETKWEAALEDEIEERFKQTNNTELDKQVVQELASQGIVDKDEESDFDEHQAEEDSMIISKFFSKSKDYPSTFEDVLYLGYTELKDFCTNEPEMMAQILWKLDSSSLYI